MSALLERKRTERTKILGQMTSLVSNAKHKTQEGATLYRSLERELKDIEDHIDALARAEDGLAESRAEQRLYTPPREARTNAAWANYLSYNFIKPEHRDLLTTSNVVGGALVPEDFVPRIFDAVKFFGPIAGLVSRKNDDLVTATKFAVIDDTGNGAILIGESASSSSADADLIITKDASLSDKLVTSVTASFEFASDVFDLQTFLDAIVAPRVGRTLETAITNAKDSAGNVLPNSPAGGLLSNVTSAGNVATSGAVAYADLAHLYGSVDTGYRLNGKFMAHSSVHDYLAAQVDSTGRPLYKTNDAGNLVLVKDAELVLNQSLPALGSTSGQPLVLFGDYSKAYGIALSGIGIRPVEQLPNLVEKLLRRFIISVRVGGVTLVPNSVKSIGNA